VSAAFAAVAVLFVALYAPLALVAWRRPLLARLAFRNAVRRRGQSALVVAGLLVGSAAITASLVGADSARDSGKLNVERTWGRVDATVAAGGGFFPASVAEQLAADPGLRGSVAGVQGGVELTGSATDPDRRLGKPNVLLVGFDPGSQGPFGAYPLTDGRSSLGRELGSGRVLVSEHLAAVLEARVGDRLRLAVQQGTGSAPVEFTVAGVARADGPGAYRLRPAVFLPLAGVRRLIGTEQLNLVRVALSTPTASTAALREQVARLQVRPPLEVRDVKAIETQQVERGTAFFVGQLVAVSLLVVAAGAALVVNLMLVLAEERRPQLGMLRAVGLTRRGLVLLSVLEGGIYAVAGAAAGTLVGVGGGWLLASQIALSDTEYSPQLGNVWAGVHPGAPHPGAVVAGFLAGAAATLLTVVFAAWRTSRLAVAASMRDLPDPAEPRRRAPAALAALGALALVGLGAVLAGGPFGRLLGGVAVIAAVAGATPGQLSTRLRASLLGALLSVWSLVSVAGITVSAEPTWYGVFFLGALGTVIGVCLLATANLAVLEAGLGLLGGLSSRLRARLRPPLAYVTRRTLRTGLGIGAFALVLLIVTVLAETQNGYRPDLARDSAGYDVKVTQTGSGALTLPSGIERRIAARATLPTRLYQGPFDATSSYGPTGEASSVPLFALSDQALADPPVHLTGRERRFESDAEVWRALRRDPHLVVAPFSGPGDEFTLRGVSGPVRLHVAATYPAGILDGVMASATALAPFDSAPLGATVLLRARPGVSAERLAVDIRRDLFGQAVDAETMSELLQQGYRENLLWVAVFDMVARAGLLVGVLSLGILGLRMVVERRRAIGVLRAVGYRRRDLVLGLVGEATIIATIGVVVGVGAGLFTGYFLVGTSTPGGGFSVDVPALASAIGLVYGATLLVTAWPAWLASRLDPAGALRQVG
jgi:putative ABC transport system permease protein